MNLFTIKTQPIVTFEIGDLGFGRPSLISKGTIDSDAPDTVVGIALKPEGLAYCFNLDLNGNYGSSLQLALGKIMYRFDGPEGIQFLLYGAHPHKKHTDESKKILREVKDTLTDRLTNSGFSHIVFHEKFGEPNAMTHVLWDVSKMRDLSCCQKIMIGGIPLSLPIIDY